VFGLLAGAALPPARRGDLRRRLCRVAAAIGRSAIGAGPRLIAEAAWRALSRPSRSPVVVGREVSHAITEFASGDVQTPA
jgi:hypothetical protein